ncbi:MAG: hypothetical protein GTO14_03380 [Anaerolineales bacterium]|nr:hypothetical protein [Anaerolineales bacterium]
MKPRERVELALNHQIPDRCPVQMGYTPEFYSRLEEDLASRMKDIPSEEAEQVISGDMRVASLGWSTSYYLDDKPYVDEWGIGWQIQPYETPFGIGHYTEICSHPLAENSAIKHYQAPDPNRAELYDAVEELVREAAAEYWIVGQVHTTIFETAWALRGFEQMMMDMACDPEIAYRLLDIPFHYHLFIAKKLAEIGVDMIFLGDDVGAQNRMIISAEMWRKYLKPRMKIIISDVKEIAPDLKIAYHTDGNVEAIIPELIEIGIDVLNPVQPASMEPAKLKQDFGDQLSFWGTIDEQHTLPFGSPEEVASEVKLRLETVGYDGGLVIAPTHAVQLDTPLENFWAMVDAIIQTRY